MRRGSTSSRGEVSISHTSFGNSFIGTVVHILRPTSGARISSLRVYTEGKIGCTWGPAQLCTLLPTMPSYRAPGKGERLECRRAVCGRSDAGRRSEALGDRRSEPARLA